MSEKHGCLSGVFSDILDPSFRGYNKAKSGSFLNFTGASEAGVAKTFLMKINSRITTYFAGGVFVHEYV